MAVRTGALVLGLAAFLACTSGSDPDESQNEIDPAAAQPAEAEGASKNGGMPPAREAGVPEWAKEHWSYMPVQRPEVPKCDDPWCINEVDAFVLASLGDAKPAEDADPATLVRRLYLDLTGLPPTPAEVAKWSKKPVDELVDHLLASPTHAEHLAVWWLDLVRFADTVGYFGDQGHHVWPYRDWVIAAFYRDMPFDDFTEAQLAGDLRSSPTDEDLVASAYNRLLPTSHEDGVQAGEYLALYAADRVANVSSVWLGSTMACARCHDHPHDPFTQRDFYSMAAFFADVSESGTWPKAKNVTPTQRPPERELPSPLDTALKREPRIGRVMVTQSVKPRKTRILPRGDWTDESGPVVRPDVPELFGWANVEHPRNKRASRMHLAQWLTSGENPLTSRVMVNRLWAMMFGRGLSLVLDDFGIQGEKPEQAQLLDWLASEFVENGWSVRHVVALLAKSHAYRQSAALRPDAPQLARQERWRLSGEVIRDQALAISGLLDPAIGGPSVFPYQPEGVWANLSLPHRTYKESSGTDVYRRSVYTFWQRQFPHPMLKAFGAPSRHECTAERPREHNAAQALALLDDPQIVEAARVFASEILRKGGRKDPARIDWAWTMATSREPSEEERDTLLALLAESRTSYEGEPGAASSLTTVGRAPIDKRHKPSELAAWTQVARAILNAAVTVTRS